MSLQSQIVPEVIRGSYLRKFALIVLVTVLATVATGWYFQQQVSAELTDQTHSNIETVSSQEAEKLSQWDREQKQRTRALSGQTLFSTPQRSEIRQKLTIILDDQPEFVTDIHYINTNSGEILESTNEAWNGSQISERVEWRDDQQLQFPFVDSVITSEVFESDGSYKIAFASSTKGNSRGIVTIVDVTGLMESFRNPYDGGETLVVDKQGTVKLAASQSSVMNEYSGGGSKALQAEQNGSGIVEGGQSDAVVAYAPVEGTNWVVFSTVPHSSAYAVRSTVQTNFIALLGISIFALLFIGLTVGRSTVASLRTLTQKAEELEEGNLDVTVESDRSDEIGELFGAFDTMRTTLKARIEQVNQAREKAETQRQKAETQRRQLQEAANRYETGMNKCADGDLTQRLDPDERNEAMKEIAEEFNYVIEQIEETIAQVKQFSEEVSETSEIVLQSTSELETASGQIAESAQVITDMTEDLQSDIERVSADVDSCLDDIEAGNIDQANEKLRVLSETIAALTERTSETLSESENIAAATEQQTAALTEVSGTAKSLDRSAGPLDDILSKFETSEQQAFYFGEGSGPSRESEES